MKLTLQDVTQKKNEFEKAGITLPSYDIEAVHKKTLEEPVWVQFWSRKYFPRIYCRTAGGSVE